jgi:XTP/dITP diphosphohydrolase
MTTLFIATRNPHKVQEFQAVLSEAYRFLSLPDFPAAPRIEEDATTFAGNARQKAVGLADWLWREVQAARFSLTGCRRLLVLADDSGLEVDALGGAPGVYSARFAQEDPRATTNASDSANNAKLLRRLAACDLPQRRARFRCVVAATEIPLPGASPQTDCPAWSSRTELFEGVCEGHIGFEPQGQHGFGYDPLFYPQGYAESFAQLGEPVKNRISHRAQALIRMQRWLAIGSRPNEGHRGM